MIVRVKTLYQTPKVRTTSSGMGDGKTYPVRVAFGCHDFGGKPLPDVPEALLPNDVLDSLPEDARISFGWTVCRVKE